MIKRVEIDEEYASNMLDILNRLDSVADRMERLTHDMEVKQPPKKRTPRKKRGRVDDDGRS